MFSERKRVTAGALCLVGLIILMVPAHRIILGQNLEWYNTGCVTVTDCSTACFAIWWNNPNYCNDYTSCWNAGGSGSVNFTACSTNVAGKNYCWKSGNPVQGCTTTIASYCGCATSSGYGIICNVSSNPNCACPIEWGTSTSAPPLSVCTDM